MTSMHELGHADSSYWTDGLAAHSADVQRQLYDLLRRATRAEAARRAPRLRLTGPELDDLATQAADDAMVTILAKLDTFRGESRFTTWAYKFAIFEVAGKLTRHAWRRAEPVEAHEQWDALPTRFGFSPEQAALSTDLFRAIRHAVLDELTERQREIFIAVVVDGVPLDVLTDRWRTNRNALYKTVFDARRKIWTSLVANGYVDEVRER